MRAAETPEGAEIIAFEALAFLAGAQERLDRFLLASGVGPADLKAQAGSPDLSVAILDFFLSNEPLLLEFCSETGRGPRDIHRARHILGGE